MENNEINIAKEALKYRLRCGATNLFEEYEQEIEHIKSLLLRSSEIAESNSLIVVGPRGCGKTTIIQNILTELMSKITFKENSMLVNLSGLIHTDDKIALKSITTQLDLDNATHGKSFGSFAENLAFLLQCLKSGNNRKSKSIIFILDDFDIFCAHHNQTLLYNLFDVAQSAQAPICVVGLTYRLDVIELLEKRVKSRFSHRQVFLHPKHDPEIWTEKLKLLLTFGNEISKKLDVIPKASNKMLAFLQNTYDSSKYVVSKSLQKSWNQQVEKLFKHKDILSCLETLFSLDISVTSLKNIAWDLLLTLNSDNPEWNPALVLKTLEDFLRDDKVQILSGLSVLELCLVIAIKHQSEIYDNDPFNFEMILNRFQKFSNSSTTMQGMERSLVFKAFEHIKALELIAPVSGSGLTKQQKVFQMYKFMLTSGQVKKAVTIYQNLPVDVSQWATSSIV
ncbi:origin recognition complex subunit 4 [Culicoides brevitarsis]|uniref:origin recognition complex subunit 4 n=1 Tax=Culicoides brevitarsis TaxID=469753 RepID=UPI00307C7BF1